MLFRGMRPDVADPHRPQCGSTASTLGVRPEDIPVTDGLVHPETGGMSVVCDDPETLPEHRKPRERGGTAKGVEIFALDEAVLPATLLARQDDPTYPSHRSVEPSVACAFQVYEGYLHGTKGNWNLLK